MADPQKEKELKKENMLKPESTPTWDSDIPQEFIQKLYDDFIKKRRFINSRTDTGIISVIFGKGKEHIVARFLKDIMDECEGIKSLLSLGSITVADIARSLYVSEAFVEKIKAEMDTKTSQ